MGSLFVVFVQLFVVIVELSVLAIFVIVEFVFVFILVVFGDDCAGSNDRAALVSAAVFLFDQRFIDFDVEIRADQNHGKLLSNEFR